MSGDDDLGFTYHERNGEVTILHHGRKATVLRGHKAAEFLDELQGIDEHSRDAQQWMARLTGNYKRGNERTAKRHPRNQR